MSELRPESIVVRVMNSKDLPAVSLLAKQLVELHHHWDTTRFFTTENVAQGYAAFFKSQLKNEKVVLLVSEINGVISGYLYGTIEPRDWAKLLDAHGAIHDIFVALEFRKSGTANALMQSAKEIFQQKNVKQLVLYSASTNLAAQKLFSKLGFRSTMVEMTFDIS